MRKSLEKRLPLVSSLQVKDSYEIDRCEISINNSRLEKKSKSAGNSTKKTNENLKMGSSFFLESASTAMGKSTIITWASRHKNAVIANDSDALYAIQGKILKLYI